VRTIFTRRVWTRALHPLAQPLPNDFDGLLGIAKSKSAPRLDGRGALDEATTWLDNASQLKNAC
jgi:hypothetical protein